MDISIYHKPSAHAANDNDLKNLSLREVEIYYLIKELHELKKLRIALFKSLGF